MDAVRRIDFDIKYSLKRLVKHDYDPDLQRLSDLVRADVPDSELYNAQAHTAEELDYLPKHYPAILVLNKIDLVNNKKKLRYL